MIPARGLPDPTNAHEALAGLVNVLADRQATRLSTGFRLTADNACKVAAVSDPVVMQPAPAPVAGAVEGADE